MTLVSENGALRVAVQVTSDGPVATLTIANPRRRNSIGDSGWPQLRAALAEVEASDARVLVVTGHGEDFCAGADLSEGGSRHPLANMHVVNEACLALHRLSVPTIARVDGYAVGAGMNLALGCDFVVATHRAKFSEIFVRRGLSVDFGGSWLLPRLVGMHRAKEMVLLGAMLEASTLHELGVVREVVAPADLDAAVDSLAQRLVAGPPIAIAQSKRLLHDAFEVGLERALEDEARAQAVNLATDDAAEAGAAFFEKREPRFLGH
ncbi:enoyl-CoA hydratase/isomerase family protein [Nocardioides dongxiaopingii]|uniref:enoyl-CoA hydratase/isomerase family protein n=1 Tax=Nocardioides dongxiaopingii TaxID=2576036 RepID=UPI0010C76298|nr:enoyl-CoA hydratase-related protein [Nocardioides dongxiaopingii]